MSGDAFGAYVAPEISMQDVRLMVGEGALTAHDVLVGCNAVLRMRAKTKAAANEAKIEALVEALGEAISRLEGVQGDTGYQLDGDFTAPEDRVLTRLRTALQAATGERE